MADRSKAGPLWPHPPPVAGPGHLVRRGTFVSLGKRPLGVTSATRAGAGEKERKEGGQAGVGSGWIAETRTCLGGPRCQEAPPRESRTKDSGKRLMQGVAPHSPQTSAFQVEVERATGPWAEVAWRKWAGDGNDTAVQECCTRPTPRPGPLASTEGALGTPSWEGSASSMGAQSSCP